MISKKLLAIVIAGAVLLGIYSLQTKSRQLNQQFEVPSDWKTYSSNQYHFSLRYPPSWGFCDESTGIGIYPDDAVGFTDSKGVSKKCYNMQGPGIIEVHMDNRYDFIHGAKKEESKDKNVKFQTELIYINGMLGQRGKITNYQFPGDSIVAAKLFNNKYTYYVDYADQVSGGCSDEVICNKELETILHSLKPVN